MEKGIEEENNPLSALRTTQIVIVILKMNGSTLPSKSLFCIHIGAEKETSRHFGKAENVGS